MFASLKDKLSPALGGFGMILSWLLLILLTVYPLAMCPFPWFVKLALLLAVLFLPDFIGGILTFGIWVWSFVLVVNGQIAWMEILYFVLLALYLALFLIPGLASLFSKK